MKKFVSFFVALMLLLITLGLMMLVGLSEGTTGPSSKKAFVGIYNESVLVLAPPEGGEVLVSNFTDLSLLKAELAEAKEDLSTASSQLETVLSSISFLTQVICSSLPTASKCSTVSSCYWSTSLATCLVIPPTTTTTTTTTNAPTTTKTIDFDGNNKNNTRLFALGYSENGTSFQSYVAGSSTWTSLSPLLFPRSSGPAVAITGEGTKILAAGGADSTFVNGQYYPSESNSVEVYDLQQNTHTRVANMTISRNYLSGTFIQPDVFLVCGGTNKGYYASCETYNMSSDSWTTFPSLNQNRSFHITVIYTQRPVVIGGYREDENGDSVYITSCEQLDVVSKVWSSFPSFTQPRSDTTGAAVVGAKIYLAGRPTSELSDFSYYFVEAFDGISWNGMPSTLQSYPANRGFKCVAASFLNKLVLFQNSAGGNVSVFDPESDTWGTLPPISIAYFHGDSQGAVVAF